MTQEETIKQLESLYDHCENMRSSDNDFAVWESDCEAIKIALSALRSITREQVEKVRGEWINTDGERVLIDKYGQPFGWAKCSACGEYLTASDEYPCIGHFCPNCGAPMTDKAVDMVMERVEVLKDEAETKHKIL